MLMAWEANVVYARYRMVYIHYVNLKYGTTENQVFGINQGLFVDMQ